MTKRAKLVFVYNAGSGFFDKVFDLGHKIVSPGTYQCNLCRLTYGDFSINKEWADFLKSLPVEPVFLYKDEFPKENPSLPAGPFPALYLDSSGDIRQLVSAGEINAQKDLAGLMGLIRGKLGDR